MDFQFRLHQTECRVCLTELDSNSTFCNVFSLCDDLPWKNKTYSQLITSCTNTEINDRDPFPKFICDVCVVDLYTAYNFKLQCELSYKNLLENKQLYTNLMENKHMALKMHESKDEIAEDDSSDNVEFGTKPNTIVEPIKVLDNTRFKRFRNIEGTFINYKNVMENKYQALKIHESENEIRDDDISESVELRSNPNTKVEPIKVLDITRFKRFRKIEGTFINHNEPLNKNIKGKERKNTKKVSANTLDKYHIKNGKFICNLCDKVCHNKRYVQYHLMLHDTSRGQFKCSYPNCERVFLSHGGIRNHILIHEGKKNFICEQCGKAFYINAHLQAHVNLTHLKIKNYKCDFCPKTYESMYKKTEHMNTHTNKRPFNCDLCEKKFFKLAHLNIHLKSHNKKGK